MTDNLPLILAAANAAGPAPDGDRHDWLNKVESIARDLHRVAGRFDPDRIEGTRFACELVSVERVKPGTAKNEKARLSYKALKDTKFSKAGNVYTIDTNFLTDPVAAKVEADAKALLGKKVLITKINEHADKDGAPQSGFKVAVGIALADDDTDEHPDTDHTAADESPAPAEAADESSPADQAKRLLALSPVDGAAVLQLATQHFGMDKDALGAIADDIGITDRTALTPADCKRIWDEIVNRRLGESTF